MNITQLPGVRFRIFQKVKLSTLCIAALLLFSPKVLAEYDGSGTEPPPEGRQSTTSTPRGECNSEGNLELLTAQSGVYATSHPTFSWKMLTENSIPVKFTLYEVISEDEYKIIVQEIISNNSTDGEMQYSPISPEQTGLSPNKEYAWQVSLLCDPDDPSLTLFAYAHFKVAENVN